MERQISVGRDPILERDTDLNARCRSEISKIIFPKFFAAINEVAGALNRRLFLVLNSYECFYEFEMADCTVEVIMVRAGFAFFFVCYTNSSPVNSFLASLSQQLASSPTSNTLSSIYRQLKRPSLPGSSRAKLYERTIDVLIEHRRYSEAASVFRSMTGGEGWEVGWRMKGVMLGLIRTQQRNDNEFLSDLTIILRPLSEKDFLHLFSTYQTHFGFGLELELRIVENFLATRSKVGVGVGTLYAGLLAKAGRVDEALGFVSQYGSSHPYNAIIASSSDTGSAVVDKVLAAMAERKVDTDQTLFNVLIRDQARKANTFISSGKSTPTSTVGVDDDPAQIAQIWDSIVTQNHKHTKQDQMLALEKAFVLYHALCEATEARAAAQSAKEGSDTETAVAGSSFKPDFYTYRTLWDLLARRPKWKFQPEHTEAEDESPIVHPRRLFNGMSKYYLAALCSLDAKSIAHTQLLLNTALLTFLAKGDYPAAMVVLGWFGTPTTNSPSSTTKTSTTSTLNLPLRTFRIILTHLYHRVSTDLRSALGRRKDRRSAVSSPSTSHWARWALGLGANDLRGFRSLVEREGQEEPKSMSKEAPEKSKEKITEQKTPHQKIIQRILLVSRYPLPSGSPTSSGSLPPLPPLPHQLLSQSKEWTPASASSRSTSTLNSMSTPTTPTYTQIFNTNSASSSLSMCPSLERLKKMILRAWVAVYFTTHTLEVKTEPESVILDKSLKTFEEEVQRAWREMSPSSSPSTEEDDDASLPTLS